MKILKLYSVIFWVGLQGLSSWYWKRKQVCQVSRCAITDSLPTHLRDISHRWHDPIYRMVFINNHVNIYFDPLVILDAQGI